MIILVDNKNFMIRLCEDSEVYHGFDTSFPGWEGIIRFLSDLGERVVVSGPEAERYLDAHNIYYIHVEHVAKESYFKFERRLTRLIEENKEYIESSLSFGKLVFAVDTDGERSNTYLSNNLVEIWRLNEDSRYYTDIHIDVDALKHKRVDQAIKVEKVIAQALHCESVEDLQSLSDEVDNIIDNTTLANHYELFSDDCLLEILLKTAAICELIAE